ncbi:hypothetical protein ABPG74_013652 [Tetrahymena malaccensis]
MISSCAFHPENQRETLCLSLQCKHKGLICQQCVKEQHNGHYNLPLKQFQECLNNNQEISEVSQMLIQEIKYFQGDVDNKYNSLVSNLVEIQKKFNQEIEALIKLYSFNKDYSNKILSKIETFLENMKSFCQVNNETQLSDLVTYFSLMVYEGEDKSFENNFKNHLEEMNIKSQTIKQFFNKHELEILDNCKRVEESIRELMCSEVDILQILEIKKYESDTDNFKILCSRQKDLPKKFSIIDCKKSQIDSLETIVDIVFKYFNFKVGERVQIQLRHAEHHHLITSADQLNNCNSVIAEIIYSPTQVSPLYVIGISGSTRCGKSTLCQQLSVALNADILHQDQFFDKNKIYSQLNGNWESQESIDWHAFKEFVMREINKKKIRGGYVIIEGLQLFCEEWMRNICDIKFFLEVEEMTMYVRRMRTTAVPEHYFWNTIIPEYQIYKKKLEAYQNSETDSSKKIHYLNGQETIQGVFESALKQINN